MHTETDEPILRPSAMARAKLPPPFTTSVPEWATHSESPESLLGPKTPSTHAMDDTMLSDELMNQHNRSAISTDSLFSSLKSAIRRVHPDQQKRKQQQQQQQQQQRDRVIITRASTATTATTDPHNDNTNNNFFSIPTIPEQTLLSPSSAPTSIRYTTNNSSNNDSVSSLATRRTMSATSLALSVIPLTEDTGSIFESHNNESAAAGGILMKGRLLCAVHMEWYSRRRATANETSRNHIRLRQSRLRWREFEAELKADRLELYLVTNLVIKTRRLAHVIYLNPNAKKTRGYNPVRLVLISPVDFIWSLQFRSCEGRNVHFLFVSRTIRESQTWYMALYRRPTTKTTPIPALIDLYIPALEDLQIRLPLADLDFQHNNVRIQYVIRCALTLLDRQGIRPDSWHCGNVSLCWRHGKHTRLEWIPDNGYLVSPHLVEQTHTLELRPDTQHWRQQQRDQLPPPVMEGELFFHDERKKQHQRKKLLYAMMEGHLLFLLDPAKATRPPDEIPNGGRHHTRFTWARSLFATQALHVRSLTRLFRPTSNVSITSTTQHAAQAEYTRRAANIMSAVAIIDMTRATKVRRVSTEQRTTFEVSLGNNNKTQLQFEASTMHTMFEWIQRIQRVVQSQVPTTSSLPQQLQDRSVLHSGMLYVRQDYLSTFKQLYCILTREKRLVLYNTCRKRIWNEHFVTLSLDQQVYVYSAEDDDDRNNNSNVKTKQPPRMFEDGTTIMESSNREACSFVIWQTAQRHMLVTLRERLSTLKFGHRLGRKGTVWVCLARSQDEKEAWVCAIHQAMDQVS